MSEVKSTERPQIPNHQMLNEIIIIRIALVFFLILYHSFAPFSGSWQPLTDEFIPAYHWISKFAYSFFLGSFVFISGYLYAHSDSVKGQQPIRKIIKKKSIRLLLPSVVFSLLYLVILGPKDNETTSQMIYSIINGRGHMWFLPMLFWLFIGMEILKHIKLHPLIIVIITFILSIGAGLPLPLQISSACQYVVFFYIGYLFYNNRNKMSCRGGIASICQQYYTLLCLF